MNDIGSKPTGETLRSIFCCACGDLLEGDAAEDGRRWCPQCKRYREEDPKE